MVAPIMYIPQIVSKIVAGIVLRSVLPFTSIGRTRALKHINRIDATSNYHIQSLHQTRYQLCIACMFSPPDKTQTKKECGKYLSEFMHNTDNQGCVWHCHRGTIREGYRGFAECLSSWFLLGELPDDNGRATEGNQHVTIFQQEDMQWCISRRLSTQLAHPCQDMHAGCSTNHIGCDATRRDRY